jgi:hypothetical protein
MTSFLSTLSLQFAKNILIGTLFPVVLFVIAMAAVVLPLAEVTRRAMFGLIFLWDQESLVPALTKICIGNYGNSLRVEHSVDPAL